MAIPIQVWDETHSTFMVGLVGIAAFVPLVTVSIVAGAVADAVDRRRLLLLSDLGLAAVTVVLLLNALADDPSLPLLFACEAAATAAYAFQRPARNALTPKLVPMISCSPRSRSRTSSSTSPASPGRRSPAC